MLRRLSFLFAFILLLSFLGEAFHRHDDGADHPDCSVCMAAVHHNADGGLSFVPLEIPGELTGTLHCPPIITIICESLFTPSRSRAPPV